MSEEERILKEAKKLPWEERLFHKNWKVRNEANVDLASLLDSISDPKDSRLRDFGSFFKKTVADSNAPVQEKALDALIAFLRAADADAGRYGKEVCDAIVAKCLTGRPKTIEKAQASFLLWVELEATEQFLDSMEKAIKNKVAKAVVPAIDVMFQALSEFGAKVVPPKRILKMLPELFDHQDQNVRASSKGLTLELCRWIGKDVVKSILFEKMRDTMKKELEAELANVTGTAKPTRKIRSEQDKELEQEISEVAASAPSTESTIDDHPQEIDEYELVDPVDILSPLDKSGFWDGVKATKWSDRRDAVAELTKLASTKRISPGDFTEVCRTLKKLITDVNMNVAVEAIQAVGNLAKGLRTHFSGSSRFLLPVLLEKLKEKKATITESLMQTLQAMHKSGCLSLADVIEDVKVAVKNKVPLVRSLTLAWITFCIEATNKTTVLKLHKDYVPICMECLNDGTPEVRDAAFSALAAIAQSVGMRPLERSLEKLDDVRKKKLSEMIGIPGEVPSSCTGSGQVIASMVSISNAEAGEGLIIRKSAASMLTGRKPVQQTVVLPKKSGATKTGGGKKGDAGNYSKGMLFVEPEEVEPGEISLEEIEARLGTLVKAESISQLKSGVWKERLAAIALFKDEILALENIDVAVEILIRFLCVVPGWGEKNVQVQQQLIEVITTVASTATKFSKRCVVLCLLGVSERVADIKTRNQAMKCLTVFAEAVGPRFVFERLYKIMKEHKNPKVLSEGLSWMVSAIEDFGVSHLKLKDLIDFCKDIGLQSSTPATRNSTIKLIGVLHKFVGPDIKDFMSDVKPALLGALEAEYEKNPYEGAAAAPKKKVRSTDVTSSVSGVFDGLPREDISGKVTSSLLKNLGSSEWKLRLESIELVNKILEEAHKRIQPTGTGELFDVLKNRLNDSNKNVVMATLATVGGIASAMGPAVEKASKGILSCVLKCLGDNKKQMRDCSISTLDSWVAAVQFDKMIQPYIVAALLDSKLGTEGRKDLFDWLSRHLSQISESTDVFFLVKPSASALMDKSLEVRKASEATLAEIFRILGQESVIKILKELREPPFDLVRERIRPLLAGIESYDPSRMNSSGLTTKVVTKSGKLGPDRASKHVGKTVNGQVRLTRLGGVAVSMEDVAIQSQPLFNVKDSNKEDRERMVVRRCKFEEPRLEHVNDLESDLVKYFREDLHKRLLSSDFKKQVEGLELLQKSLPSYVQEVVELLDILLRWFVLRFCESNTTCLLKVLGFLGKLFEMLRIEGYGLTESEAALFLPCWVEKSGHSIEKVRKNMHELTKQIILIYSASKLFPFIMEGLRSKNNRTRIVCVELVGYLVDHHVTEISGQLKSLQLVASLTSERDGEIRNAALNTLVTAYKALGEDVWKYVGKLSDVQKSMLDDRFKWKAREMDKKKEGKPGDARVVLRRSIRDNGLDVAEQSGEVQSISLATSVLARESGVQFEPNLDRHLIPRLSSAGNGPDWNEALEIISAGSPEESVEGMKVVCHELTLVANDPECSIVDELVKDADRLVACLATKVAKTFDFSLAGASSRSCKYVLNTLMQTFQLKKLAHTVKESTLDILITELLLWLLDERVPLMDDGSQLLKALNVLMLKILDNAERTSSFVVLINLLRPLDPSKWPSPLSNDGVAARNQKFSDLVVKCLIKLTKVLQSTIFDVDLDQILRSIHIYLQGLGMEEIRRRAGADDKPLRMVKTVLHELVKLRGTAIKGHLSMVPIDMEPQPIILAYIDLNLQTLAAARMLTPSVPVGQTHWADSASNNASPASHTDAQLKQELAAIFKKIGDKQTCSIGLYELYCITQLYPKADIFGQLQNASEAFRTYIRDGLAEVEKNAAAGRTPSSLPLPTPPPVVLPIPSPKHAPLSPMQDKSFMDTKPDTLNSNVLSKAFSDESSSFAASFKGSGLYQQDTRLQDLEYGQVEKYPSVSSGTLDAIRERMKNIQIAAGTGSTEADIVPVLRNGSLPISTPCDAMPLDVYTDDADQAPVHAAVLPVDEKALSGLQARMERLKLGSIDQRF